MRILYEFVKYIEKMLKKIKKLGKFHILVLQNVEKTFIMQKEHVNKL